MIQSSLTFQGEHEAWRQRVNKEIGNTEKFYKTVEMNSNAFANTGFTTSSMAATTVKPYHRSNGNQNMLKKGNYYMIDSSYVVASNPNTMRDLGPCRNAEYYFKIEGDDDDLSGYKNTMQSFQSIQNPQDQRKQFIKGKGNKSIQNIIDYKNRDVYRFGGKTRIGSAHHHRDAQRNMSEYEQNFYQTNNKWTQSTDLRSNTIVKDKHVQVNDYSKNVSQAIFNPGMIHSSSKRSFLSKTPAHDKRRKLGVP